MWRAVCLPWVEVYRVGEIFNVEQTAAHKKEEAHTDNDCYE